MGKQPTKTAKILAYRAGSTPPVGVTTVRRRSAEVSAFFVSSLFLIAIGAKGLPGFVRWPGIASLELIDDIAVQLDVDRFVSNVLPLLADAGHMPPSIASLAIDDVELGAWLATSLDARRIAIRLAAICTDAYRRFDADHNAARRLCIMELVA